LELGFGFEISNSHLSGMLCEKLRRTNTAPLKSKAENQDTLVVERSLRKIHD
jgi:hypothetical protein